jgi:hypothetical protein
MAPDVSSPAASARAGDNGGTTELDTQVVKLLRKEVAQRRVRVDELETELNALKPDLRRYERILAQLDPDAAPTPKKPGRPRGPHPGAGKGKGISDERLAAIRAAVLDYAAEHDEFAQVDIRAFAGEDVTGGGTGIMTLAFETLRQEGTIRFARQEGNRKMFRLTRAAARENA